MDFYAHRFRLQGKDRKSLLHRSRIRQFFINLFRITTARTECRYPSLCSNVNNIFFEKRIIALTSKRKVFTRSEDDNEKVFGYRHSTNSTLLQKVYSLKKSFYRLNLDGRDIAVGVDIIQIALHGNRGNQFFTLKDMVISTQVVVADTRVLKAHISQVKDNRTGGSHAFSL